MTVFPLASLEQNIILENLEIAGSHVIVDAVAGSGKSTSVMHICRRFPGKKVLQLTYNASLRLDLKKSTVELGISSLDIHTFHSAAVKFYNNVAYTDSDLRKIVQHNAQLLRDVDYYDIIVLDESQDMCLLYYNFVQKFLFDMRMQNDGENALHTFQIVILGDYKQSLYEFKGSDFRFLTLADVLWNKYPGLQQNESGEAVFVKAQLKTSYRVTTEMASFVNETMLGEYRLEAIKTGPAVVYIRQPIAICIQIIVTEITRLIREENAKAEDFFILAASVRHHSCIARKIENELVANNIACFLPNFESGETDDRTTQNKVVFSSFHAVKGRQRSYVFVLDFSQNYMDFAMRDQDQEMCPNTLYVACTRATKRLYIHENVSNTDQPCEFLKHSHLELQNKSYVDFNGQILTGRWKKIAPAAAAKKEAPQGRIYTSVTDLLRFISEESNDLLLPLLEESFVCENPANKNPIDIPIVHQCANGNWEEVSEINGITIPTIYFDRILKPRCHESLSKKRKFEVYEHEHEHEEHEHEEHEHEEEEEERVAFAAQFSTIYDLISREMLKLRAQKRAFGHVYNTLLQLLPTLKKKKYSTADYLFLANAHQSLQQNLFFKLRQIDRDQGDYNWLSANVLRQCFAVLNKTIPAENFAQNPVWKLEEIICESGDESVNAVLDTLTVAANLDRKFGISARVDLVTNDTVYEIKCTSQLSTDHLLQLVMYAWIWRCVCKLEPKQFKILNIRSGELQRLECSNETLCIIANIILKNKTRKLSVLNEKEFIHAAIGFGNGNEICSHQRS